MGLDMYLTARRFFWDLEGNPDHELARKIEALVPEGAGLRAKEVRFEAAYWRKANAIHAWFVANCQDGVDECQETYVELEKLQELMATVDKVLENNDLAGELLPTRSGFFFGGTEFDEWYFRGLRYTSERLHLLLENERYKGMDFYYQSSW